MNGKSPFKNDTRRSVLFTPLFRGRNYDRPRLNHSRRAKKITIGATGPFDKESLARINGREDTAAWQLYWLKRRMSTQVMRSGAQQVSEELSVSVYGKE